MTSMSVSNDLPMTKAGWCFVYVIVNLFQLHWVSLSVPVKSLAALAALGRDVSDLADQADPKIGQTSLVCVKVNKPSHERSVRGSFHIIPNLDILNFINLKVGDGLGLGIPYDIQSLDID